MVVVGMERVLRVHEVGVAMGVVMRVGHAMGHVGRHVCWMRKHSLRGEREREREKCRTDKINPETNEPTVGGDQSRWPQ